ncbi:MAG TPA: metallophosphoesterase [Candidatus Paceibacterota bacterium]|jgi:predicted MPP superfamily phosphohydrolase|nr:metallophosphoesterase [Candidatus Paceibacterota bacterium]
MNSRTVFFVIVAVIVVFISLFTSKVYSAALEANPSVSKTLSIVSLFIAFSYMASLLLRRSSNVLHRTLYTILNIIAGIFFYLFLGAIALGIIDTILFLSIHTAPLWIGWAMVCISVLASIIGFIQARIITVKRYSITLPHAPASWNGKTAVLVTDTHFGLVNYKKFSDMVVQKILSLKPDFVLHGGDFYDGPIVDTAPLVASWKKLTEEVLLFYTPGNHEAYGDYELFVNSLRQMGATVLDDKVAEYDGVQIAGTLYHSGRESKEVAEALAHMNLDSAKASILINHPPTSLPEASEANISLMVSGHTHRGQFWPFRYITRRVYKGYDYGVKAYKNMTVVTSNGVGTFGPPLRFLNSPEVVLLTFNVKSDMI